MSLSFTLLTAIFLTVREYSTRCFLVKLNLISFLLTFIPEQLVLNDYLTKVALSCSATSDTDDMRYKVKRCLESG